MRAIGMQFQITGENTPKNNMAIQFTLEIVE